MTEIIPALLPTSTKDLEHQLSSLPRSFEFVQIDIIDPEILVDPALDFEVHFMIENPDQVVDKWLSYGAKRIIVHQLTEKVLTLRPEVELGLGVELGVELEEIYPLVSQVDFIQLMSIKEIGKQGNKFSQKIFDRIKELKKNFPEVIVSIDGGVSLETADDLILAGAERLVVGSAILGSVNPEEAFENFLKLL